MRGHFRKRFRDLPIKRKLMALFMLISSVVFVATTAALSVNEAISFRREQLADLSTLADIIGRNTAAPLIFDDPRSATETLAALGASPRITAAYLFTRDERLFARYRARGSDDRHLPLEKLTAATPAAEIRESLDRLGRRSALPWNWHYSWVRQQIGLDGQMIGTVVIQSDLSDFNVYLYRLAIVAALVMTGAIALAYLLASRLQHLISAPILTLMQTMREVSASKNYALRASKPSADEIGLLFDGFNEMLGEIEDRNEKLRQRQLHLQHIAHFDSLTALPNRVLFYDRLTQALRHSERYGQDVAVMFIDLDHFKDINDSLGHRVGDLLLTLVSQRLSTIVRACDTVARLGGDEFTIFVQNICGPDNACKVARLVVEQFASPFQLEGREIYVSASIGITIFPFDGDSVDQLLKNADLAMYRAKDQGKNGYQLFSREMNLEVSTRLALQNDLRQALEQGGLSLYYQPKMELRSGRLAGFEALLRWQHPQQGMIMPMKFIPLAENTGLIVPLGEWVLRSACRQVKAWQAQGHPAARVAVNLSAHQFKRQDVVKSVQAILTETGLDPALLELELTESALMQGNDTIIEALQRLRSLGIRISIDDFGTGYSSLSYLHRFPIDSLKIDKSFIWNLTSSEEDSAIITAIIAMARSLHLKVIAEGVETAEQLAFLEEQGCHEMQGYLVSRPVPASDVADLFFTDRRFLA